MPDTLDLAYPAVLDVLSEHRASGRTESRAFLGWFLEHYYRLETIVAQDCVCDGPDDKGIDGIYVDNSLEKITLFQARLFQNTNKTLGDRALREFSGALTQFSDASKVEQVAQTTKNAELAGLLQDEKVAAKLHDGYALQGVFVTNVIGDRNARALIAISPNLRLMDGDELNNGYISSTAHKPIARPVSFDISGFDVIRYKTQDANVIVAAVKATELVGLDGIQNGELFDWNVRQSLGRTRVNKAISESIEDPDEHRNFLLYHNGLTILAEDVSCDRDEITLSGYSVVNGCQSLTTLFENKDKISSELRILGRLIQIPPNSDLAARITRHSNNQNSISARDLQSNSTIQRRLQREMEATFPDVFYEIKRGEHAAGATVITNEAAARVLLAFDVKQPWTCHQTYKMFGDLHTAIFARPEVTAKRIIALNEVYEAVQRVLGDVDYEIMARYRLLQFFLIYLLRSALETDEDGVSFCKDPGEFVQDANGRHRLQDTFVRILSDIVMDLNAEVEERQENAGSFDYKRELKSPQAVRRLERDIITMYKKAVKRKRASGFWRSLA